MPAGILAFCALEGDPGRGGELRSLQSRTFHSEIGTPGKRYARASPETGDFALVEPESTVYLYNYRRCNYRR
jgi:hypothetical protein